MLRFDRSGSLTEDDAALREAAWVARCVGRAESAPLRPDDVDRLADLLEVRELPAGHRLNGLGAKPEHVCIVRQGRLELSVPTRGQSVIIQTLHEGDVDGDIQVLLGVPMPYETRSGTSAVCLILPAEAFDTLLLRHPHLARRWLTSVSQRLARSHNRLVALLGRPLPAQVAQVLLDESLDGAVDLPQATIAAMVGAARPSVNRVLKSWEAARTVQLEYGRVLLTNPPALERVAREN